MRFAAYTVFVLVMMMVCATIIVISPHTGLRENEQFFLYRTLGINRGHALLVPQCLIFIAIVYGILSSGIKQQPNQTLVVATIFQLNRDLRDTYPQLFEKGPRRFSFNDFVASVAIALAMAAIFGALLLKFSVDYKSNIDMHWHQAFLDYDLNWGTPWFSLTANVLNNFGIQAPLNANLSLVQNLAHAINSNDVILTAVWFLLVATFLLVWLVGAAIRLKPVPRAAVAAVTALISVAPKVGAFFLIVPTDVFPNELVLGLWWHEAALLALFAGLCFFWLGQMSCWWKNVVIALLFAVLCYDDLLAYPAGAVFFVPVIAAYCCALLFTSTTRQETLWKVTTSIVLASFLLLNGFVQFFAALYGYAFGDYFIQFTDISVRRSEYLLKWTLLATRFDADFRTPLIFIICIAMLVYAIVRLGGDARRVALAVLTCEVVILALGAINAFFFHQPISLFYVETMNVPMLLAFGSLFFAALFTIADDRLANITQNIRLRTVLGSKASRIVAYSGTFAFGLALFVIAMPPNTHFSHYPPDQPGSVKLLKQLVAVGPDAPFRGRVLTIVGTGDPNQGDQQSVADILASRYRRFLGNDHYIDLLASNIPEATEYAHWTSPITFIFLRAMFDQQLDRFHKAFFSLRSFDLTAARLMGIKAVVTDADSIPGGELIYHTQAGDAELRIFELKDINLGQYSPTRQHVLSNATDMILLLRSRTFDPTRDVILESQLAADLTRANFTKVTIESGPALRVEASSLGQSLLVLPFEFSHCLVLEPSVGTAELLPVNLQQTGFLFNGKVDARITYRFGPFGQSRCRQKDIERANALDLRDTLRNVLTR